MAWALGKSQHFTLGNNKLIVLVDHKPLLKILGDRELANIKHPRILSLKQKMLRWRFSMEHVPGKDHHIADAESRFSMGNLRETRHGTLGTSQEANVQISRRHGRR